MSETPFVAINTSLENILNCQYLYWYNLYSKYTITPAKILSIPHSFVEYLEADDIALPHAPSHESTLFQSPTPNSDNEYSDWEEEPVSSKPDPTLQFADFHKEIQHVISDYKSVAPKLNWSAPQDALWITTGNTMKCRSTTDLYLLLKSSDYINHDLYHAFDDLDEKPKNVDFHLVLRKWSDINPALEFRCFVNSKKLIAISQKDLNYYSYLPQIQDEVQDKIEDFFEDVLLDTFTSNSYIFDVYVPKPYNKVYLVDINLWSRSTDSLLFSWHELANGEIGYKEPEFRLVTEHNSGRFSRKAHGENHVPREFLEAGGEMGDMVKLLKRIQELETQGNSTDDEEY